MAVHTKYSEHAAQRVRAEYDEMPGLCLTVPQATRLLGLEPDTCSALLAALVEARVLRRTRDGAFVRADAGGR